MLPSIEQRLAVELAARPNQVAAAIGLLDEGATVPFIARYRKEVTGGLDDTQLRTLEERLRYLRELEARRAAIIASTSNWRMQRWAVYVMSRSSLLLVWATSAMRYRYWRMRIKKKSRMPIYHIQKSSSV